MHPQKDDLLRPCLQCRLHYRAGDAVCPHCGAPSKSGSVPGTTSADERFLGRVMYGPSPVDHNVKEGSAVKDPEKSDPVEDALDMRVMYGPTSFVKDDGYETASGFGITFWIIIVVLLIGLAVWFLFR